MVGWVGVLVWLVGWGGCLGRLVASVGWLTWLVAFLAPEPWPGGMREAIKFAAACKADGRDSGS